MPTEKWRVPEAEQLLAQCALGEEALEHPQLLCAGVRTGGRERVLNTVEECGVVLSRVCGWRCGKNGRARETDKRIYVWLHHERGWTANVCHVATYIEPLYMEIQTLNLIND